MLPSLWEQERIRLEQQLYAYFKTDKRLSKLRAAKLHSYWKRICSDEEKSRLRNEKILRDFERIEGHLCSVTSRTEKLKLLKKQYEEQVKEKYPEWKSLIGQEKAEKEVQQVGVSISEHSQGLGMDKHHHVAHSKGASPKHSSSFLSNIVAVHDLPYDHTPKSDQGRGSSGDQRTSDHNRVMGFPDSGEVTLQDLSGSGMNKKREFSHEDIASQIIEEVEDEEKLGEIEQQEEETYKSYNKYTRPPSHMLHVQQTRQHESQITDHKPSMETVAEEEDEETTDYSDANIPDETLPVRPPLSDRSPTDPSHTVTSKPELPENNPPPYSTVAGLAQHNLPAVSETSPEAAPSSADRKGAEPTEQHTPRSLLRSDTSSIKSNSPLPDLTIDGLLFLVRCLQQEIPHAVNVDSYYRCQHPPLQARKDIVRQANQGSGLGSLDGNAVSMVILEQLTLVVRELAQECLLSDAVLLKSHTFDNEKQLRAQLLRESQQLWDKLFEHFHTLLKYKVMGPQEIAAVFVPGLVADKSANQDKAFSLIVRMLETSMRDGDDDEAGEDLSSVTFSARANILLPDSPNSPQKPAPVQDVPPLSLGSMIDKQTDEESDFFDQSLPRDPVPLNETAAYKNMLSGTFSSGLPTVPQREEDDTDDDVENQFASVLSPRTPKNKPGSARSPRPSPLTAAPDPVLDDVMSEISSTSPPVSPPVQPNSGMGPNLSSLGSSHRNPALKIGSDLDSDTDVELPMSRGKTKSKTSLDDDFDFYG